MNKSAVTKLVRSHSIIALYKDSYPRHGACSANYDTMVNGKLHAVGGLPDKIDGRRVVWTRIPGTLCQSGITY